MSYIYIRCVTLLVGFDFIISAQVSTESANATFQNIDFVEIVKEDLRRNNEDYGDIKLNKKLTSATKGFYGTSKKNTIILKVENNEILKNNRRTNADSTEYSYDDKIKSTTKENQLTNNVTDKDVNPVKEVLRSQTNEKVIMERVPKRVNKIDIKKTLPTLKPTTNVTRLQIRNGNIPKFVNKNKIDKFKKFMSKNKGLLKDFLSSKMEIQTKSTKANNALRINELLNMMKPGGSANTMQTVKNYPKGDQLDLPNPDMLDMAPARGGRIHRHRVKGRLCQRHVLVPEGPKYDSQGKWYLPAHKLVVSHPYNVTRPPRLLLPRCCNCCKKSVLGCE